MKHNTYHDFQEPFIDNWSITYDIDVKKIISVEWHPVTTDFHSFVKTFKTF